MQLKHMALEAHCLAWAINVVLQVAAPYVCLAHSALGRDGKAAVAYLRAAVLLTHVVCVRRWSKRVLEEFFQQGDMEKAQGLPLSPLMDRANTALAPSQINFIEFVVAPLFLQASLH